MSKEKKLNGYKKICEDSIKKVKTIFENPNDIDGFGFRIFRLDEEKRNELISLCSTVINIENDPMLISTISSIWESECMSGNGILINSQPVRFENQEKKGFISCTYVKKGNGCSNNVYLNKRCGLGYSIKKGQNFIIASNRDLQSGNHSEDYERINTECFSYGNEVNIYAKEAGTRLFTPKMAMEFDIGIGEIIIPFSEHQTPDYLIFDGTLQGYVNMCVTFEQYNEYYCSREGKNLKRPPIISRELNKGVEEYDRNGMTKDEIIEKFNSNYYSTYEERNYRISTIKSYIEEYKRFKEKNVEGFVK